MYEDSMIERKEHSNLSLPIDKPPQPHATTDLLASTLCSLAGRVATIGEYRLTRNPNPESVMSPISCFQVLPVSFSYQEADNWCDVLDLCETPFHRHRLMKLDSVRGFLRVEEG